MKIYLDANNYDVCDHIICEIPHCKEIAVDINHIEPRGMGGSKTKDFEENLIAMCRKDHNKFEAKEYAKEYLKEIARKRINDRSN